ncbi:MAG TPA: hypothetical protein DCR14_00540, partial [Acidimicrobiaceae bacterium]|nr:hypothetical protein [Acidimicrobiaceae bacterium]
MTDAAAPSGAPAASAATPPAASSATVPASTYQLLRERLHGVADRLDAAAQQVNRERAEVFAAVPLALAEQDRLRTEYPAHARDVVAIDDLLLFGFHASVGLQQARTVADTFSLYTVQQAADTDWAFNEIRADDAGWFLSDPAFVRDLGELFTYYAQARLLKLQVSNGRLLMVFSVGSNLDDVRVLRWQLTADGPPTYIDAYGELDVAPSEPFDFEWVEAGRELVVEGRWRHLSIAGVVHVGIDRRHLEFRVDDAVEGGRTILTEPLAEEQSLDDLKVRYALLGDVLLVGVRPYREADERCYIVNRLTRAASRVDAVRRNCHQLPEGQGVVFPGGYHLQNGDTKVFTVPSGSGAAPATGFGFHASHRSPNGEDILYAYYQPETGEYLLCAYNVVSRTMANPVVSDGYALFDDGLILTIRHAGEPQRVHTVGVYTSPFCDAEHYAPPVAGDSFHGRVGNPELVRVLGEAFSLARDARDPAFNAAVFEAMVGRATVLLDAHAWLAAPEGHGLGALLVELRKSAGDVLDEFETVVVAKREAVSRLHDADRAVADLVADAELELRDADTYIDRLAAARASIGSLVELRDVREIDLAAVDALTEKATAVHERLARRAVDFLGSDDALNGLLEVFAAAERSAPATATVAAVAPLVAEVEAAGERVVLLTEVVSGLEVADATVKTAVLTRLSDALARRNGARATLDARVAQLRVSESAAAFQAGLAVVAQRSQALLMTAAETAQCDSAVAALAAELENLDLQYGDVAAHAEAIANKRDEVVAAFAAKRDSITATRAQRVTRLVSSAQRLIDTVTTRAATLADRAAVDTFFSTDPLVAKVRTSIDELAALGEAGPAGELDVALGTARDQARRTVADRAELFEAGTVRVGRWKLGVNTEPFELRLDPGDGDTPPVLRLSGTDLVLPVPDDLFDGLQGADLAVARQTYPTETAELPRALYLAFDALLAGVHPDQVASFAAGRIDDGYEPGVHDADAAALVTALEGWWAQPAMRHRGVVRAVAGAWLATLDAKERVAVERELAALATLGAGRALRSFTE